MTPRLITIGVSHFCEKVRWALQRAGIEFVEQRYPPGLHMMPAKRAGGRSTPILVTEGETLTDSTPILAWVDARTDPAWALFPSAPDARAEVEALEDRFDGWLADSARCIVYWHILPRLADLRRVVLAPESAWNSALFTVMSPIARPLIRKAVGATAERAERAEARLATVFDEVEARLADGRPYLMGDVFTAADLAFAALAAPAVMPDEYGARLPPVSALPEPLQRWIEAQRARPAGQFALRLYRDERSKRAP